MTEDEPTIEVPVSVLQGIADGSVRITHVVGRDYEGKPRLYADGGDKPADRDAALAAIEEEFGPDEVSIYPDLSHVESILDEVRNPKDAEARRSGKARLDLLEPAANTETAHALAFGAAKYGVQNYITIPIHARVYLAAIQRHLDAWKNGEDVAEDSGVHHLGHIAANVHIALAAMDAGSFVDDRGPGKPVDDSISDPAKVE